jgi:hypothetical protein
MTHCPYCGAAGHRHVVPSDTLPTATFTRTARCQAARSDYSLVMPEVAS